MLLVDVQLKVQAPTEGRWAIRRRALVGALVRRWEFFSSPPSSPTPRHRSSTAYSFVAFSLVDLVLGLASILIFLLLFLLANVALVLVSFHLLLPLLLALLLPPGPALWKTLHPSPVGRRVSDFAPFFALFVVPSRRCGPKLGACHRWCASGPATGINSDRSGVRSWNFLLEGSREIKICPQFRVSLLIEVPSNRIASTI